MNRDNLLLKDIRIEFLNRLKNDEITSDKYKKIITYMSYPRDEIPNRFVLDTEVIDLKTLKNEELVDTCLTKLNELYRKDERKFSEDYKRGQYIVWDNVFRCAENLINIKKSLSNQNFELRESEYFRSCSIVKENLELLADGFKEMTLFEKKMGVDRYLATEGLKDDIEILHDILKENRKICNQKLEEYIKVFQRKWNLTSIAKSVKKSLDVDLEENEVSDSISNGYRTVIFFLFDGFGYTQYLWSLSGLKERKSLTYGINLFEWLRNFDEFNDNLILASNLVTDTASCLASIFSGKTPSETGILAAKVYHQGRVENVKRIEGRDLLDFAKTYPNSFLDDLKGIDKLVLNGSGKSKRYDRESFPELLYGDSKVVPVRAADRIFKTVTPELDTEADKQFISVYFPLIDRTGHSIGAFTSFESYEYEKLNILLVDFLLDLAYNKKELFDGKTKIIFSADHGMFETSSKFITFHEVLDEFKSNYKRPPIVAVNNRSLILYNIDERDLDEYKSIISGLMDKKGISSEIYSNDDDSVKEMFPQFYPNNRKTVVVLFKGNGIAIQREMEQYLLHYGGHGGCSCEEVFVPLITLELTPNLYKNLISHFSRLK